MKTYATADIRNFALVGHGGCGKTILAEAMLYTAGVINRIGSVENGSTVSDYHPDEQQRQMSIHASLLNCEWQGKKLNFTDTPGYMDFISESLGALRVSDCAVVVVDASSGVELGTTQVWDFSTRYDIPKVIVVNGCDKEHADFEATMESLRSEFGRKVFPMNVPMNPGPGFSQVLDVMRSEVVTYEEDGAGKYSEAPAEGEWKERVEELHGELIEYVAESDDSLMEKYFEEGLTEEELRGGIHAAFEDQNFIPVFVTSALHNIGVARLMDFLAKFGGSPEDRATIDVHDDKGDDITVNLGDSETSVFVYKLLSEAHVGELSFFRVYSGSVAPGMDLLNTNTGTTERIGQIFTICGHNRDTVESMKAGDIGAFVKLKNTHTGNTLADPKRHVVFPPVEYPKPNIHGALKLKSKGDEDKIAGGLATLHEEDPAFVYRVDPEIQQTVLSGQGELHLQVICDRLKDRFHVEIELVEPRIPFRETIKGRGESKYRHKKQSGGAGQFAEVWMRVETAERDTGINFTESLVGQNVDRVFVPSVEKGVNTACNEGILAGCRVVDVKIDFYDGKMHPVDSKDVAFQIAGRSAFREAFLASKPCLLEPIYKVSIKVPEEFMGDVMGDISSRRGRISGMDAEGNYQIINATVPQMELYRYSTVLRSLTGGRGLHTEEFSHYEEMQRDLEGKVIEMRKKEMEEE